MRTPELKQTPYLWDKSHCGQSSSDESEQSFPVQGVPPFLYVATVYLLLSQANILPPIIPFEAKTRTFSTYSWEVFSKENVVNAISANRDILAQGLEHAKEFKKPCY
jgi:hypothetical protein